MCSAEVLIRASCLKRPPGVRPTEGLAQDLVEVFDERERARSQVVDRSEAGSLEEAPRQDGEPDLNLVEPRAVTGCVDESDSMGEILQKRPTGLLRFEDAVFSFDAQVGLETAASRYQLHQFGRQMRVELV